MCKIHYLCLSIVLMFTLSSTSLAAIAPLEPYAKFSLEPDSAPSPEVSPTPSQEHVPESPSELSSELPSTAPIMPPAEDKKSTNSSNSGSFDPASADSGSSGSASTDSGSTDSGSTNSDNPGSGGTDSSSTDSSSTDSGSTDSGSTDSGTPDSGGTDSSSTDSGSTDSDNPDSGGTDSDNPDSGGTNSSSTDSGGTDSDNPDSSGTDSDNPNSGAPDSGSTNSSTPDSGITAAAVTDLLRIDSTTLYPGMENTYAQGYVPKIENGNACIVLPLAGDTYDQKVTMSVDLGATADSPFIFGNYSQTAGPWDGVYLFRFEIPLAANRVNGTYPVTLTAAYLNAAGNQTQQSFTIYVTITDGKDPNQNVGIESERKAVEKPRLFISACEISPGIVSGEEEFTVALTIENIGAIRARSVILSYGSDAVGIVPKQTNNFVHLANIAAGRSEEAFFELMTTREVLAGNQSFYVKLDYEDLYGGIYTETRTFFVGVTQPAEMEFDPISIPRQVTSGETISIPINVFNTGKSTLQNVFVTISVLGLYPTTSSFFGDVPPGQSGSGEMKIHVGTLSLTGAFGEDYGRTSGVFTITYYDENGEEHRAEVDVSTEIMPPAAEDVNDQEEERTAGQWWISVLVAFAVIAIMIASMVVTRFSRLMRIKQ